MRGLVKKATSVVVESTPSPKEPAPGRRTKDRSESEDAAKPSLGIARSERVDASM